MSATNESLARIFREMAALLELKDENRFRINAYERVAQVLEELPADVALLARDPSSLLAIEGIGEKSAKKIVEFVTDGRVREHDALREEIPPGLLEVLAIPGVGPKTAQMLWHEAGVIDLASLESAIDAGHLDGLPRMGAKTIENMRKSIAFAAKASERMSIGRALPLAEAIVERLRAHADAVRVEYAGSLRRGAETIGDVDILAATSHPEALSEAFRTLDGVAEILAAGPTKSSVRLESGVQVDVRVVEAESFGAALMYFTGSKAHNVALRERAIARGLRLNEYGLFEKGRESEGEPVRGPLVAARTEQEIYAALGLPWIPPELREDRGELDRMPPALIEIGDVVADLHTHTVASDGLLTIDELAEEALRRGLRTIAITDHSKASAQAGGLSEDALVAHIERIRAARTRHPRLTILAGSEVDIHADGRLDYDDSILALLDVVVASPHSALAQDPERATARLIAAAGHPLVHVIGHPTGRLVGRREGLQPDIQALVEACAKHGTALEINANAHRLDLRDIHVKAAVEAGAYLSINTDAHSAADFDQLRYGVLTARRGWLTADRCINTWSSKKLCAWLDAKKKPKKKLAPR